ncbi:MAG: hypothetical protein S4CHLAM6_08600 [Chlamydiae bacterium]|nr:hypothetical protein [Chlamydiota bacterium]
MSEKIKIVSYQEGEIKNFIPDIARLRIEIFAEYPFLYDGDFECECKYLEKYASTKNAIVVVAYDNNQVIGISTGYPFADQNKELKRVFQKSKRNVNDYFCLAESILLKQYRGKGVGRKLFDQLEVFAKDFKQYKYICLFTSARPADDPKRPKEYRSTGPYWSKQGFCEHPELTFEDSYKEIEDDKETQHKMIFWIKELDLCQ